MVDLPDTMVDLPNTMVDLPDSMVDLPDTMVYLPDTMGPAKTRSHWICPNMNGFSRNMTELFPKYD